MFALRGGLNILSWLLILGYNYIPSLCESFSEFTVHVFAILSYHWCFSDDLFLHTQESLKTEREKKKEMYFPMRKYAIKA